MFSFFLEYYVPTIYEKDEAKKKSALEEFAKDHFPKTLYKLEFMLKENGEKFIVGDKVCKNTFPTK